MPSSSSQSAASSFRSETLTKSKRRKLAKFIHLVEQLEERQMLSNTLVITKGGTYTGTWESDDPNTPAVTIKTSDPVIIQNSTITSMGDEIDSAVSHVNLTVNNVKGYGLNPNVAGKAAGAIHGHRGLRQHRCRKQLP